MVHEGTCGISVNATELLSEAFALVQVREDCHLDVCLSRATLLDGGRCTYGQCTLRNNGVIQNNRVSSNDCTSTDFSSVKNDCSRRHLREVVNDAPFKVYEVADNTVITDCRMAHGGRMHNGAVLDAGSFANDYRAVIAT
jgi:hypothetical protein